jgi:hypothetical protein
MPIVVVLVLGAFFVVGLWLIAAPVSQARLDRFIARYSLRPTTVGRSGLRSYLAKRRRARVAGVLVAASVGLFVWIPEGRVEFQFVPLLVGWLAGASAVELVGRRGGVRCVQPVRVSSWWSPLPAATAVIAVLWTAAAVSLRSEGVRYEPLLGWGAGALATILVVIAVTRYAKSYRLRDLDPVDPGLGSATAFDAARDLTIGGMALALLCLARVWIEAVPGPYAEAQGLHAAVWLVAIITLVLLMTTATASWTSNGRRGPALWAAAVVAVLPMTWAVPVRLAQEPPFGPQGVHPNAQIRVARLDRVPAAQTQLGLKPDRQVSPVTGQNMATELIGRVDLSRPAPAGAHYQLFAFDRRTNAAVTLFGANGAGWNGRWSSVLPARYTWLSDVVGVRDAQGFTHDPMAVSLDPQSEVLWFRSGIIHANSYSADALQLVLMLVRRGDGYIYWATPIPSATEAVN